MLDINKLRNAYNVIHRMSQNRHPFAEEELSLEAVQSAQVQEALTDAAEVIAVYGKIMNLVSQSTSFKVAPKTSKAVKSSFVVEQDDLSRLQPMTEATNITKLVKYINDTKCIILPRWSLADGWNMQVICSCRKMGAIKFRQKRVLSWVLLPKSV